MKTKKYILVALLIILAATLSFYRLKPDLIPNTPHTPPNIKNLTHVITQDARHQRTISWQHGSRQDARLEYRLQGQKSGRMIQAVAQELPSVKNNHTIIYTTQLTDLKAGATYEYRISMDKQKTDWQTFHTPPDNLAAFKTLIFGDSQAADYSVWGKTAQNAWEKNKDATFFINMGDIVDNGQDDWQWDAWYDGAEKLLRAIPFSPVMGNHEAYSLDWKMAEPKSYLALFAVPANGPPGLERYAYSYDYGDVHFAVLNTQLNELRQWQPDLLVKQKTWLAQDLAKTDKKWKVVLMHRGNWQRPFVGPLDEVGQTFVPIFDQYQVDLVYTAHIHSYARTVPIKGGSQPAPGGTVYITTGRSGDRTWDAKPPNKKPFDQAFYNPLDMPNYLTMEVFTNKIKIAACKQDGTLIDQGEIVKAE